MAYETLCMQLRNIRDQFLLINQPTYSILRVAWAYWLCEPLPVFNLWVNFLNVTVTVQQSHSLWNKNHSPYGNCSVSNCVSHTTSETTCVPLQGKSPHFNRVPEDASATKVSLPKRCKAQCCCYRVSSEAPLLQDIHHRSNILSMQIALINC